MPDYDIIGFRQTVSRSLQYPIALVAGASVLDAPPLSDGSTRGAHAGAGAPSRVFFLWNIVHVDSMVTALNIT